MKNKLIELFIAIVVALAVTFVSGGIERGQATTLAVDIDRAKFTWNHAQGTGDGAAKEFLFECGPSTGNYNTTHRVPDPALREYPVKAVVGNAGQYFCVLSAVNQFGKSVVSNEVFFDAGNIPAAPSDLGISVQ